MSGGTDAGLGRGAIREPRSERRHGRPARTRAKLFGALCGRWTDGVLQRSAPVRRRAPAGGRDGGRDARQRRGLAERWRKRGHELDFGVGIAQRYATLGRIRFDERSDYAAIGTATNLAARPCAKALGGRILISQPVYAATEGDLDVALVGDLDLKGFSKPVRAYNVIALTHADQRRARAA